jgi:O-antigen ligase
VLLSATFDSLGSSSPQSILVFLGRDTTGSTHEHLATIEQGLALFLSNPLFGAGLGAFIGDQVRTTGTPLIIHSTPVWLLAETGIAGFAVFMATAGRIVVTEWPRRALRPARFLILILGILALMSELHELLYQRGFWLLLGGTLAVAAGSVRRPDAGLEKASAAG